MSRKITNQGYFLKRLRDCGYIVDRIFDNYAESDPRSWTVMIDPGGNSIFCTCYVNREDCGDSYLELYDGNQFIPNKFIIKTLSVEVLVDYLIKFNIRTKNNN